MERLVYEHHDSKVEGYPGGLGESPSRKRIWCILEGKYEYNLFTGNYSDANKSKILSIS